VSVVELPKATDADFDSDETGKPCWSPCVNTAGTPIKPFIRCNCGKWTGIGLHHVHADGTVTASFYHAKGDVMPAHPDGCEWHVFIKLKDYDQGDFPPEPLR
jgi:hypothetical protein